MDQKSNPPRALVNWLFFTAFMVFAMAVIGAVTRLTESGLSMVEWKPLIGAIPPLNAAQWEHVFSLYKQTPEFQQKNSWMTLADFKHIFFWEWLHRLWGRTIGLVYALPLLWFWMKGRIPAGYKGRLLFILLLGGAQGVMGWYMVMSGLIDVPAVSHFRLAAHLMLAVLIYISLLWVAFSLKNPERDAVRFCLMRHGWTAFAFIILTMTWGAFVAGLDGGMVYNSWPKMDTYWIPPEVTGFFSILHDPAAAQFFHRWIAIATFLLVLSFAIRIRSRALAAMVLLQVALGVSTVILQVPVALAALHQAGALSLIGIMVYELQRRRLQ